MAYAIRRRPFRDLSEETLGTSPDDAGLRPSIGGLGLTRPPISEGIETSGGFQSLVPRRRSAWGELGQTAKEKGLGILKSEAQERALAMLKERFGGALGLNPVHFPGEMAPAQQGFAGAEEAFPGASTAGTWGTPEAFSAAMSAAGLPEFPAAAAGMAPWPGAGSVFTEAGNLIPELTSLWSGGGGLAGGLSSNVGSAIGAGAEGGIAAGGAGAVGGGAGSTAGAAAGSVASGIAIPLAALNLVAAFNAGKTNDLSDMAKYDPIGLGPFLGSVGGTQNKNYSRNFFGNLKATNTSIGKAFETLAQGLPGAQSQEDLAQLVDNLRSQIHGETGIGAYGMPRTPGYEGREDNDQYRRSGPLDIPGLPGVGERTHGQPTTPIDWGETRTSALAAINALARQLPSGPQTKIPAWASQNQPTTSLQRFVPADFREFESSWYSPEGNRVEDLSPYERYVTTYPEPTYAESGPAYAGFPGPPTPPPAAGAQGGFTVPDQGIADIATSLNPPSPGFLAGTPARERGIDESLRLHKGGVVPGAPGEDVETTLEAGETVLPAGFTKMGHKGGNPLGRLKSLTISFAHNDDKKKARRA